MLLENLAGLAFVRLQMAFVAPQAPQRPREHGHADTAMGASPPCEQGAMRTGNPRH
jgi:hypothetical protein